MTSTDIDREKTCFIAMPMTTHPDEAERYGDPDHWLHVMRTLFAPAIRRAGFKPVEPTAQGSDMIHGHIIANLAEVDLVLCDLSSHNPNVLFELGVRTALDKPVALVRDELTSLPFDTNGLNTATYASSLKSWDLEDQIAALADHISKAASSCAGSNPMWRRFGLGTLTAQPPTQDGSTTENLLRLVLSELSDLRNPTISNTAYAAQMYASQVSRAASSYPSYRYETMATLGNQIQAVLGALEYSIQPEMDDQTVIDLRGPFGHPLTEDLLRLIEALARERGFTLTHQMATQDALRFTFQPSTYR